MEDIDTAGGYGWLAGWLARALFAPRRAFVVHGRDGSDLIPLDHIASTPSISIAT